MSKSTAKPARRSTRVKHSIINLRSAIALIGAIADGGLSGAIDADLLRCAAEWLEEVACNIEKNHE